MDEMWHVSLTADRCVRQHGTNLGATQDCTIEEMSTQAYAQLQVLLAERVGDGYVLLDAEHRATLVPPSQAWSAARDARRKEAADLAAAVAAHHDPVVKALAARLGIL